VAKLDDILKRIGKQITYYREQKNMNQSDLARELNKDRQFIQRIEKGRSNVTMKTLYEISTALDITINDLLEK
jgi:transcriptional regulator with XRE-family HTH domain